MSVRLLFTAISREAFLVSESHKKPEGCKRQNRHFAYFVCINVAVNGRAVNSNGVSEKNAAANIWKQLRGNKG